MTKYLACSPNYDETYWFTVEAFDREMAAEEAAEYLCAKDSGFYELFEHGETILVKDGEETQLVYSYNVFVEMVPSFSAVAE